MRHLKSGRKLKRNSSHRKALLNNLATSLFEHKKIVTTEAKAKELRAFAEGLITKAKHALRNEKLGLLPEGHKVDIHNRRIVGKFIRNKAVLQELFDTIAPMVEERPGGYTRVVKLGSRRGDGSPTAIIELVDWSAPQDGAVSTKSRRKGKATQQTIPSKKQKGADKDVTPSETQATSDKIAELDATLPETADANLETTETQEEIQVVSQEEIVAEASEEPIAEAVQEPVSQAEPEEIIPQETADDSKDLEAKADDTSATDSDTENQENKS